MKIKHTPMLMLAGVLILSVTLACSALTPGGNNRAEGQAEGQAEDQANLPETGSQEQPARDITVTENEFKVRFEPGQPSAGEVTFTVKNTGHAPHDFRIWGNGVDHKTSMIDPGESETFSVQLEPGTYKYECTVEGHSMLGMRGSLTVADS